MQQLLDTALDKAAPAAKERFAALTSTSVQDAPEAADTAAADDRLSADPNIGAALDWLDQHAGWDAGTARRRVVARLARLDVGTLQG